MKLTTNCYLVPGLKISGAIPPISPVYLNGVQKEKLLFSISVWFVLCLLFNAQLDLIGANEKGRRVKLRVARNSIIPVLFVRPSFLVVNFHDLSATVTCSSYYA